MAETVADLSIVIRARNAAKAVLGNFKNQINNVRRAVFSLNGVLGALGLSLGINEIKDATIKLQRIDNSLKFVAGSSRAAGEEFKFVRVEAKRLGLDLSASALEYAKLTAASKGTILQGQKTREIFLGVAEAGTVLGLSVAQQSGALTAIQQIISKGIVSAEELRGQLGERLPGAFQIASRAMGVTTQELGKMLERGELASDVFLPKFAAELRKTFGPQVNEAAKSLNAKINRMNTAIFNLKILIGKSGLIEFISSATEKITVLLPKLEGFVGLLASLFKQVGKVVLGIVGVFNLLISGFFGFVAALGSVSDALNITEGQFEKFTKKGVEALKAYEASIQPISDSFRNLLETQKDSAKATESQSVAISDLDKKISSLTASTKKLEDINKAFKTLDLTSEKSTRAEIEKIRQSFLTLLASGEASVNDLARAEARAANQTKVLLESLEVEKVEKITTSFEKLTSALLEMDQAQLRVLNKQKNILSADLSAAEKRVSDIREILDVENELANFKKEISRRGLSEELRNFATIRDIRNNLRSADQFDGQERIRILRKVADESRSVADKFTNKSLEQRGAVRLFEESLKRLTEELKKQKNQDPTKNIKKQFVEVTNNLEIVRSKFNKFREEIASVEANIRIVDQDKLIADARKLRSQIAEKFSLAIIQDVIVRQRFESAGSSIGSSIGRAKDRSTGPLGLNLEPQFNTSGLPSFASGIRFVPRDMVAQIHQGETVLPRSQAEQFRKGQTGNITFGDINIQVANSTEAPEKTARRIHSELQRIDERRSV